MTDATTIACKPCWVRRYEQVPILSAHRRGGGWDFYANRRRSIVAAARRFVDNARDDLPQVSGQQMEDAVIEWVESGEVSSSPNALDPTERERRRSPDGYFTEVLSEDSRVPNIREEEAPPIECPACGHSPRLRPRTLAKKAAAARPGRAVYV